MLLKTHSLARKCQTGKVCWPLAYMVGYWKNWLSENASRRCVLPSIGTISTRTSHYNERNHPLWLTFWKFPLVLDKVCVHWVCSMVWVNLVTPLGAVETLLWLLKVLLTLSKWLRNRIRFFIIRRWLVTYRVNSDSMF